MMGSPRELQQPPTASSCPVEQDLVICVDSSASVGEADFELAKEFLRVLLEELSFPATRVGIIRFEDKHDFFFVPSESLSNAQH